MARRQVVEITCDRCGKVETQATQQVTEELELMVEFRGQKIKYEDLCGRCRGAVENYFKSMTKQLDEEDKSEGTTGPESQQKKGFLGMGGKKAG